MRHPFSGVVGVTPRRARKPMRGRSTVGQSTQTSRANRSKICTPGLVWTVADTHAVIACDSLTEARGSRAMATETPEDFRDRALECEQRALTTRDPKARAMLLYVAAGWRALAIADEAAQRLSRPGMPHNHVIC